MKAPLPMPSHPLLSAHVPMSTYVGFVLLFLLFLSPLLLSSSHVCCWQASVVHSTPHIECPLASFPGHLLSTPSGSSWPSNSHQPQAALHGAFCDAIVLLEVLFLCRTIYCTSWPGQTAKNIVHQSQKEPMERGSRSGKVEKGREHCLDNYPCPLVWRRRLPTADPWPRLLSINNFSNKSWARTPQTEWQAARRCQQKPSLSL